MNVEDLVSDLSARELSELRALLNSDEWSRVIDDYECYPSDNDDE